MYRLFMAAVIVALGTGCSLVLDAGESPGRGSAQADAEVDGGGGGALDDARVGDGGDDGALDAAPDASGGMFAADQGPSDASEPADMMDLGEGGIPQDGTVPDEGTDGSPLDMATPPPDMEAGVAEDAGPAPEDASVDAGVEMDPPPEPCAFERRCNGRVVEVCANDTVSRLVCRREERCVDGDCELLPENVYGQACRGNEVGVACAMAGLACGGIAQIPFCLHPAASRGPIALGDECYGPRECVPGLLCSRVGQCVTGEAGTSCLDDLDCVGVCVEQTCQDAAPAEKAPAPDNK